MTWSCRLNEASADRTAFIIIIIFCITAMVITVLFNILFIKNLICETWNHLEHKTPSLRIKFLAVLMPLMLFTTVLLILTYTICFRNDCHWIWGDIDIFFQHNSYTDIARFSLLITIHISVALNWSLYPLFILENIRNLFSKNKIMNSTLDNTCCKYFHCYMLLLIIIEPMLYLLGNILHIFEHCNPDKCTRIDHNLVESSYYYLGISYVIIDNVIHTCLITILIKGFHKMAAKYYNIKYIIDSRLHENIVEMTRYFVTFGSYIIIYTVLNIITILFIVYKVPYKWIHPPSIYASNLPVIAYVIIKEMTSIICVYLSFEWNHIIYERICCCDKCCKKQLVRFELESRKDSIQRYLLKSSLK